MSRSFWLSMIIGQAVVIGLPAPLLAQTSPPTPPTAETTPSKDARKPEAPAKATTLDEERGRQVGRGSTCDAVDPPNCPTGCMEDTQHKICVQAK